MYGIRLTLYGSRSFGAQLVHIWVMLLFVTHDIVPSAVKQSVKAHGNLVYFIQLFFLNPVGLV